MRVSQTTPHVYPKNSLKICFPNPVQIFTGSVVFIMAVNGTITMREIWKIINFNPLSKCCFGNRWYLYDFKIMQIHDLLTLTSLDNIRVEISEVCAKRLVLIFLSLIIIGCSCFCAVLSYTRKHTHMPSL